MCSRGEEMDSKRPPIADGSKICKILVVGKEDKILVVKIYGEWPFGPPIDHILGLCGLCDASVLNSQYLQRSLPECFSRLFLQTHFPYSRFFLLFISAKYPRSCFSRAKAGNLLAKSSDDLLLNITKRFGNGGLRQ